MSGPSGRRRIWAEASKWNSPWPAAASAGRKREVVAPSRQNTPASRDGRSLRAPLDRPRPGAPVELVAERGQALGEARGVIGVQRLAQHRGAAGRGREKQRAGGDGLRSRDLDDGHASEPTA